MRGQERYRLDTKPVKRQVLNTAPAYPLSGQKTAFTVCQHSAVHPARCSFRRVTYSVHHWAYFDRSRIRCGTRSRTSRKSPPSTVGLGQRASSPAPSHGRSRRTRHRRNHGILNHMHMEGNGLIPQTLLPSRWEERKGNATLAGEITKPLLHDGYGHLDTFVRQVAVVSRHIHNLIGHPNTPGDFAEDGILAVEKWRILDDDEEL